MNRLLRFAVYALVALALAGAIFLGWAWHADRARRWEPPVLSDSAFVPLRAGQRVDPGRHATWMVAVNLRCPRCLGTLRRLDAASTRRGRPERLIALIVDQPRRPRAAALHALPAIPVWWDRDHLWRRRWGHRLYGEVLRFDPDGRYLGTVPAGEAMRSALTPVTDTPPPRRRRG
jgi:hypothetical protein